MDAYCFVSFCFFFSFFFFFFFLAVCAVLSCFILFYFGLKILFFIFSRSYITPKQNKDPDVLCG